jgi:hypothetical protein
VHRLCTLGLLITTVLLPLLPLLLLLLLLLLLQVWVVPELRDDGCIYWTADSDSQLTKVGAWPWGSYVRTAGRGGGHKPGHSKAKNTRAHARWGGEARPFSKAGWQGQAAEYSPHCGVGGGGWGVGEGVLLGRVRADLRAWACGGGGGGIGVKVLQQRKCMCGRDSWVLLSSNLVSCAGSGCPAGAGV